MIRISELSLQRGSKSLLQHANAQIFAGQKVALIGENGCGKSSLFQLLLSNVTADAGDISKPNNWRCSFMSQEVEHTDLSAVDYVLEGDQLLTSIQQKIKSASNDDQLAQAYALMDQHGGFDAKRKAETLLHGLGFNQQQLHLPVKQFSGGWRIRLNLAQALLCPSDLMLLDEPTNHLDIQACYWLEQWLKSYTGTLVFVSHDRDFIDAIADQILSFEEQQLYTYKGNYSAFEKQKAERIAQKEQARLKQQERVQEIESFVSRFRAKASKAKQAQSRLKELQRMQLISAAHIDTQFSFQFPCSEKQSDPLINLQNCHIGYEPKTPLLQNINLSIHPGMRVGLLGVNGAGKSTFIKALTAELLPMRGDIVRGLHLNIGYFAQHQLEALDNQASALLHLQRDFPKANEQALRNFLGGYGFQGERADEAITLFSGGEKARLALARITYKAPNLLLLDEPTNHLDIEIRHALTLALQQYQGAVLIISHDRHLLKNTVDEFWLIDQHKVSSFAGDLEDYHQLTANSYKSDPDTSNNTSSATNKKDQRKVDAQIRKQLAPLKKQILQLEKSIEKIDRELLEIEQTLADTQIYNADNKEQLKQLLNQQQRLQQQKEPMEEQWLDTMDDYEQQLAHLKPA